MTDFPRVEVFDGREEDGPEALASTLRDLEIAAPFVLRSVHGRDLSARIGGPDHVQIHDRASDQKAASDLGSRAHRTSADAIVAVGGGRCIDIAKLAAARAGLRLVVVPTQLSHDGICSPVAVVPDDTGMAESVGAVAPQAVFLSLPTLLEAPLDSVRAGLGDLLANPFALRDWALAAERGLTTTHSQAWDLSVESYERIKPHLDSDPEVIAGDARFLRELADALILSGTAMICAGSSRPASGGEHEVSHAIDQLHGGRALHGSQVAFGCIFSIALYGEDVAPFIEQLRRLGLPAHPGDLGLSTDEVVRVLLAAPETRPGRFTILEDADLDEAGARSLVATLWPDAV